MPEETSPLTALRDAAFSGESMDDAVGMLREGQIVDPSAKWDAFTGAVLQPASGGFGQAYGRGMSALAEGKGREAELKAKYVPLIAQALMQRQIQATQLAAQQWKLQQDFDSAITGGLAGLLSKPGPINGTDVAHALANVEQRGLVPKGYAAQAYAQLPLDQGPEAVRQHILQRVIGSTGPQERLEAVTPKVEMQDVGGARVPANLNPNAPAPLGALGARPMPKSYSPSDIAGALKVEKDQAGNSYIVDSLSGTQYFPRGAEGPAKRTLSGVEFDKKGTEKIAAYYEDLQQSLDAMRNTQMRLEEMKKLVSNFQPGAAGEARLALGAWAKDLAVTLGLSPEQGDNIAQTLAKGDISDAQAFQKLAIQGTLDILKAANPRFTQMEFGVLSKNNPSLALDPAALDKMMNFMSHQYQAKSAELAQFTEFRREGNDLLEWPAAWNRKAQGLKHVVPTVSKGAARSSLTPSRSSPVSVSNSGRKIKLVDNQWVYDDE